MIKNCKECGSLIKKAGDISDFLYIPPANTDPVCTNNDSGYKFSESTIVLNRKKFIINRLYRVWRNNPQLRLGQLIWTVFNGDNFFNHEDEAFMDFIELKKFECEHHVDNMVCSCRQTVDNLL